MALMFTQPQTLSPHLAAAVSADILNRPRMFYNGRPTSITDRLQSLGGTYPQQAEDGYTFGVLGFFSGFRGYIRTFESSDMSLFAGLGV